MFVRRDPRGAAGIPDMLRTAFELASSRAVNRVFLEGESSAFVHRWRARLPVMPWQTLVCNNGLGSVREQLDVMAPLVLVATHGIPDVPNFLGFLDDCQAATQPRTWILDGAVLAVYYPAAGDLPARLTGESDEPFQQAAKLPHAPALFPPLEAWQEPADSHRGPRPPHPPGLLYATARPAPGRRGRAEHGARVVVDPQAGRGGPAPAGAHPRAHPQP